MAVLTKITQRSLADNAVTSAKIAGDVIAATDIADDAVGTAELANDLSISTSGNIATTGSGTLTVAGSSTLAAVSSSALTATNIIGNPKATNAKTIASTYANEQERVHGTTFTTTGSTITGDVVFESLTDDTVTLSGTGTITGSGGNVTMKGLKKEEFVPKSGGGFSGAIQAPAVHTGKASMTDVQVNDMTLSGSITGGTFQGTIGDSATFPAGHVIQIVPKYVDPVGAMTESVNDAGNYTKIHRLSNYIKTKRANSLICIEIHCWMSQDGNTGNKMCSAQVYRNANTNTISSFGYSMLDIPGANIPCAYKGTDAHTENFNPASVWSANMTSASGNREHHQYSGVWWDKPGVAALTQYSFHLKAHDNSAVSVGRWNYSSGWKTSSNIIITEYSQ